MKNIAHIIVGALLCITGPLVLLSGTVYTLMLPNIYEGTAVMRVIFPENSEVQYTEDALIALTRQRAALVTQSSILYYVMEALDLQSDWGPRGERLTRDVTRRVLENSVRVSADPTAVGIIKVTVRRDNPSEAATIANELILGFKQQYGNVELVDIAETSYRPVSPNLFKNVLLLFVQAVVFLAAGLGLLINGIKKARVQAVD